MEVKDIYIRTKNRIVLAADLGELYALIERVAGKAYKEVIDVELCDNDGFDTNLKLKGKTRLLERSLARTSEMGKGQARPITYRRNLGTPI